MSLECPRCRSANIQSLELVYSSGFSTGSYSSWHVAHGRSVMVSGTTTMQTKLSKKAAPPMQPIFRSGSIVLAGFFLFLAGLTYSQGYALLGFGIFCTSVLLVLFAFSDWAARLDRKAKEAQLEWSRKFMCLGCGSQFIPTALPPIKTDF